MVFQDLSYININNKVINKKSGISTAFNYPK